MSHPVETGSLRTNHSDAALWRRLCLAPTLDPQRGIWQKNKGPTPRRNAASVGLMYCQDRCPTFSWRIS